jgi:hypothetical protein
VPKAAPLAAAISVYREDFHDDRCWPRGRSNRRTVDCVNCERPKLLVTVAVPSRVKDACAEEKARPLRRHTGLISLQTKRGYKIESGVGQLSGHLLSRGTTWSWGIWRDPGRGINGWLYSVTSLTH